VFVSYILLLIAHFLAPLDADDGVDGISILRPSPPGTGVEVPEPGGVSSVGEAERPGSTVSILLSEVTVGVLTDGVLDGAKEFALQALGCHRSQLRLVVRQRCLPRSCAWFCNVL